MREICVTVMEGEVKWVGEIANGVAVEDYATSLSKDEKANVEEIETFSPSKSIRVHVIYMDTLGVEHE